MFYHINLGITGISSWTDKNNTRENSLFNYLCPYLCKEVTFLDGCIFNMNSYGSMEIYSSNRPIDSDWPIKTDFEKHKTDLTLRITYKESLNDKFGDATFFTDVTEELFKEAILAIDSGKYQEYRKKISAQNIGKEVFMVCPFGNSEVDHNYEYVIKPTIEKYGLVINRVDHLSHTQTINEKILESLNRALFVIGDLTDSRPNCYYEVGYAHAQRKPVILLAKEGTVRHFDINNYKWNYWNDYTDLKPKFEREVESVINELKLNKA